MTRIKERWKKVEILYTKCKINKKRGKVERWQVANFVEKKMKRKNKIKKQ